nr:immunoglobulin light chain junction region [Macaca mulatta]
CQHYYSIPDRF